ncbi:unnamed protein product [Moneuplotes crassus]|uniref:Uncharacterized protein n=1 Tax=Euplotes crassus TaxID=5936 RepID=A0AAD1XJA7_EUPCR|nr:unnamed protein product [Moneuplotes crassus]
MCKFLLLQRLESPSWYFSDSSSSSLILDSSESLMDFIPTDICFPDLSNLTELLFFFQATTWICLEVISLLDLESKLINCIQRVFMDHSWLTQYLGFCKIVILLEEISSLAPSSTCSGWDDKISLFCFVIILGCSVFKLRSLYICRS